MDQARILIAADEAALGECYAGAFSDAGHEAVAVTDGEACLREIHQRPFDLVLLDLFLPGKDGVETLQEIKRVRPSTLVVLVSAMPAVDKVIQAFRLGAFDFLVKPVSVDDLEGLAERAVRLRHQGEQRRRLAEALEHERWKVMELRRRLAAEDPLERLVGTSPALRGLAETVREVARTDSTVLLTGESGTGKGLVARMLHDVSSRADGPFVEVNCAVYSEEVLHSELFGHEQGAFTSTAKRKRGRFELARGGTLFLDEIGEISPSTQLLLLRVLQDKSFERVGGEETLEADVRLVAATNRDLQEAMRRGSFRSDLYYRLNVIPLRLPPLRDRPEDVPVLAQRFLQRFRQRRETPLEGFTQEALDALCAYAWPGNVRELENLVERLAVLAPGPRVRREDLPAALQAPQRNSRQDSSSLRELERVRILDVLRETGGNKKRAAERLGIHRSTLYAKLRRYGLDENPAGDSGETAWERTA